MPHNPSDDIIIRPRPPVHQRLLLVGLVLAALAVMLYAAYYYGKVASERLLVRSQRTVGELNKELESVRGRLVDIQASLTQAERQLQIDKAAYAELGTELKLSHDQLASLRNELRFYRSILSPEDGEAGVRIQEFSVVEAGEPREYAYRLILIQALQHSQNVEGALTIDIEGTRAGNTESVKLPQAGEENINVKFKYFQTLEGTLELPDGFVPGEVTVLLKPRKKKAKSVERRYRWSDVSG